MAVSKGRIIHLLEEKSSNMSILWAGKHGLHLTGLWVWPEPPTLKILGSCRVKWPMYAQLLGKKAPDNHGISDFTVPASTRQC